MKYCRYVSSIPTKEYNIISEVTFRLQTIVFIRAIQKTKWYKYEPRVSFYNVKREGVELVVGLCRSVVRFYKGFQQSATAVLWSLFRSVCCPVSDMCTAFLILKVVMLLAWSSIVMLSHSGLHFSSHHPAQVKRSVASCLFCRARTVAIGDNIEKEEEHLNMVLRTNGYPDHVINIAARPTKKRQQEEPPRYTVCLPYVKGVGEDHVKGVGEDLRRVCRKYNIRTIFTTVGTLRRQLTTLQNLVWYTGYHAAVNRHT